MTRFVLFVTYIHILLFFFCCLNDAAGDGTSDSDPTLVHIGAVLDMNSPLGSMADSCIQMAISDFYEAHPNYTTRRKLHVKSSETVLDANFAVQDLLNNENVLGILWLQDEVENIFMAELGESVHVPVISFTARSSVTPYKDNRYFVKAAADDAFQAKALAAVCQGFEWPAVGVIYEDTDYGNQFFSHLIKALQEVEIGVDHVTSIPISADDSYILKQLEKLKKNRVFLVHMRPSLGYRLFRLSNSVGIMSEGYAWIISDSLSNFMTSVDLATRDAMEGIVGIRPYVHHSEELENFQKRWKRNMLLNNNKESMTELNVYGLWAYDAVTALAIAVEKVGLVNSTSLNDVQNLRISSVCPRLLINELLGIKFRGLAGEFSLLDGKLKQSALEIFNVYGYRERTLGFWTPGEGIIREISSIGKRTYSTSIINELRDATWPGYSLRRPNGLGWAIPATVRVGVPWRDGFAELGRATVDHATNQTNADGFAVDVFRAALKFLPFPINYEFRIYNDTKHSTYDEMLQKIPQDFDMVVADTTIRAPRAAYVEFSLPYCESGGVLVVKNKKPFDMRIFTRKWNLWLVIVLAGILYFVKSRVTRNHASRRDRQDHEIQDKVPGDDVDHAPRVDNVDQMNRSPLAILVFLARDKISKHCSISVLVGSTLMAFILMQCYTANISTIAEVDLDQLVLYSDNYYIIGYQGASFMKQFLTEQLHISASRLRNYTSPQEYHHAMSLGSKQGGIDAIFDEIPYMKLFLNKYDSQYKMLGPTFRTGGFGFAFSIGSPLVSHFSKAVLKVTQGLEIYAIEQKNLGPGSNYLEPLFSTSTISLVVIMLSLSVPFITIEMIECITGQVNDHLFQRCVRFYRTATGQEPQGDGEESQHGEADPLPEEQRGRTATGQEPQGGEDERQHGDADPVPQEQRDRIATGQESQGGGDESQHSDNNHVDDPVPDDQHIGGNGNEQGQDRGGNERQQGDYETVDDPVPDELRGGTENGHEHGGENAREDDEHVDGPMRAGANLASFQPMSSTGWFPGFF